MKTNSKTHIRDRRHRRVRAKVVGTATRPRLAVYKSNKYLEVQVIDDGAGKTLASVKLADATAAGEEIAKRSIAAGVSVVVFDRGGFRYTGKVAALADAARKGGLKF